MLELNPAIDAKGWRSWVSYPSRTIVGHTMSLSVIALENRFADIDYRRHDITSILVASGN